MAAVVHRLSSLNRHRRHIKYSPLLHCTIIIRFSVFSASIKQQCYLIPSIQRHIGYLRILPLASLALSTCPYQFISYDSPRVTLAGWLKESDTHSCSAGRFNHHHFRIIVVPALTDQKFEHTLRLYRIGGGILRL
jgi:hypothetical protein